MFNNEDDTFGYTDFLAIFIRCLSLKYRHKVCVLVCWCIVDNGIGVWVVSCVGRGAVCEEGNARWLCIGICREEFTI